VTLLGAIARRSLETPTQPLTSTSLAEWIGGGKTKAGAVVTEARVYGLPAYMRALTIRASVEAALPLKVFQKGSRERVTTRTVLDAPNPAQRPFAFWQTMRMNGIAQGNSFATLDRDGSDQVTAMWPCSPRRVRVEPVEISGLFPDGKLFIVTDRKGREHRMSSWRMLHIPYMSPDGVTGVSAFQAYRESLGGAIAADDTAHTLFAKGLRLAGTLNTKDSLDKTKADALKQRWRDLFYGVDNAGEIAVMDNGAEFKSVNLSPHDAELLLSRKWSVSEIARMVGVLPHMIGDTEKSTSWGTGIEQQFIGWVQTIVYPDLVNIAQICTHVLPGGWDQCPWYTEHTLEGLLRGDSAARAEFYAKAIQWGWMVRNEVRVRENLEQLEGLDEPLTPSNMTLITIDGKPVPLSEGGINATSSS
jgi:HK97 family phage portal protein